MQSIKTIDERLSSFILGCMRLMHKTYTTVSDDVGAGSLVKIIH